MPSQRIPREPIEGFFKTIKHRFGLRYVGQSTKLGVFRWLILVIAKGKVVLILDRDERSILKIGILAINLMRFVGEPTKPQVGNLELSKGSMMIGKVRFGELLTHLFENQTQWYINLVLELETASKKGTIGCN